jgi:putative hydrolase of the HAD superfamily
MIIRAVIFDFGGVICFPPTPEQWREAAEFCGTSFCGTPSALHDAFWKHRGDYDGGADAGEYWRGVATLLGLSFDDRVIAGMIQREIAFWSKFDERVLAWAAELQRAGIRTGILSNLPRPLGERLLAAPGFMDHFDHATFSYELGVIKPDSAIYQHAIEGLGIAPNEGLFLDDREENVAGGLAAGLHSEQFVSWEDFAARQLGRYRLPRPPA